MDLYNRFVDKLFSQWFWLPDHIPWSEFENKSPNVYMPQPRDLLYVFPTAVVMFVVRILFEKYIAYPYGVRNKISTYKPKASSQPDLEKYFKEKPYLDDTHLQIICKSTDLKARYIQRWFRTRRNQDRPSTMKKFTETAWRLFYYIAIFIYGVVVLWDKPWLWDVKQSWANFPQQHNTPGMFWYYMIELGFYTSLVFSQFTDVKRKDFWEHFIHHIATIALMVFSWVLNLTRVGTLVLCLHDVVDWFLEGAKLNRYMNNTTMCDLLFAGFTIMWLITRLIVYPYTILYTTSVDAYNMVGYAHSLFLFNGLLWILQVLHVLWFIIIARAAYKAVVVGVVEKDIRSASEESEEESTANCSNVKKGSKSAEVTNGSALSDRQNGSSRSNGHAN